MLATVIGYLAAICMVCGYLPQAIATIRTRDTEGIAMPTFLMMGFGSLFFVIQGIMCDIWSLALANIITFTCSAIVFGIKVSNDRKAKRTNEHLPHAGVINQRNPVSETSKD